jgi:glucose/arabinose dehydrogenase
MPGAARNRGSGRRRKHGREDFMTGLVNRDADVWGRPVGVAVAKDGALLVTDDQSNIVWRVSYGK